MNPAQQHAFEQFWRAYPRKVAKLAAQREWERRQPDLDTVLQALAQQRQRWTDQRYIPHPRTWLHQGRWLDETPYPQTDDIGADWWDECRQRHDGRCNGRRAHAIQVELDALKSG